MSAPSDPPDEQKPAPEGVGSIEAALDETLDKTFPASDAANLHQWAEMRRPAPEPKPGGAEKDASDVETDRLARYLKGPTAFCA